MAFHSLISGLYLVRCAHLRPSRSPAAAIGQREDANALLKLQEMGQRNTFFVHSFCRLPPIESAWQLGIPAQVRQRLADLKKVRN